MSTTIQNTITAKTDGETGSLEFALRQTFDNGGLASNSNRYTLTFETAGFGQEMEVNGEPTGKVDLTIVGDWEFYDFVRQLQCVLESMTPTDRPATARRKP